MKNKTIFLLGKASEALNKPRRQRLIFTILFSVFALLLLLLIRLHGDHAVLINMIAVLLLTVGYAFDISEIDYQENLWDFTPEATANYKVYCLALTLPYLFCVLIGCLFNMIYQMIDLTFYLAFKF
jgi:hypothetical protein